MQVTKQPLRLAPEDSYKVPDQVDRTAGVITLIGGISAVLSVVMPWLESAAFGISLIKPEVPGAVLAVLALISVVIAMLVLLRRPATRAIAVILVVLAVVQVSLAVWHLVDVMQAIALVQSHLVLISAIGSGLYMGVLGSVITLAGSIFAWTRRSSHLQT